MSVRDFTSTFTDHCLSNVFIFALIIFAHIIYICTYNVFICPEKPFKGFLTDGQLRLPGSQDGPLTRRTSSTEKTRGSTTRQVRRVDLLQTISVGITVSLLLSGTGVEGKCYIKVRNAYNEVN